MNRPGSISVQGATSAAASSTGAKCGPSGPARNSCNGVSDIRLDPFQKLTRPPPPLARLKGVGKLLPPQIEDFFVHVFIVHVFSRGITSTSHPFEVGMPVPSVSPPINRQVGGP